MAFSYNFIQFSIILSLVSNVDNIDKDRNKALFEKFCTNASAVKVRENTIDGLWNLSTTANIFIAQNIYSFVSGFHKDFPIINEDFPVNLTQDIEIQTKTAQRFKRYEFKDHYFYLNDVAKNVRYLMGFNNIWFDCPQDICLDSATDAIDNYDFEKLIVFRGQYYWTLNNNKNPNISTPNRISQRFGRITTPLDSVTRIADKNLFFVGENVWYYSKNLKNIPKYRIDSIFPNAPNHIDCSLFSEQHMKMFIFKGDQYWVYAKSGQSYQLLNGFPVSVKRFHKSFPKNIDSCFADHKSRTAKFFIRWKYFSVSIDSLLNTKVKHSELNREYSFINIFGCNQENYNKWGLNGYNDYLEVFGKNSENSMKNIEIGSRNLFPNEETPIFIIILVILIMFIALVILTSVGFVNRDKKSKTIKVESTLKSKTTKSIIKDLPSREVQSIVIQTDELKPISNSAFDWKSSKGVKNKDNKNDNQTVQQKVHKKKKKHKNPLNDNKINDNKSVSQIQKTSDNKTNVSLNPTLRTSLKL